MLRVYLHTKIKLVDHIGNQKEDVICIFMATLDKESSLGKKQSQTYSIDALNLHNQVTFPAILDFLVYLKHSSPECLSVPRVIKGKLTSSAPNFLMNCYSVSPLRCNVSDHSDVLGLGGN